MKIRSILSLALALIMVFAVLAACGGNDDPGGGNPSPSPDDRPAHDPDRYLNTRPITVGIWWNPETNVIDSAQLELTGTEDNPVTAQMRLDNIRAIEERYNVKLNFVDMTWDGVRESIASSIMAGAPDVDIYCMDLNFGIPYVMAGYCLPISAYATDPEDGIWTDQTVFTPLNVCNLDEDYLIRVSPPVDYNQIPMLGYNKDRLDEFNQPDPQDLWDSGQWTWDAWLNIMRGVTDFSDSRYGWGGGHVPLLTALLISNGTGIAVSDTENLTATATLEVFDFIYNMYNTENVARPWDGDIEYWDNNLWQSGQQAFFIWYPWLAQRNGITKGFPTDEHEDCPYTIRVVPWPIGPSGNRETNNTVNMSGNVFMIPIGTPDAHIVYKVFYDYNNWYNYDLDLRDDAALWVENLFGDDVRGLDFVTGYMSTKPQFDMWDNLVVRNADGDRFGIGGLLDGSTMASGLAEQWRQVMQDYIDAAYGK
ncbi:MAG: extracellular solute-binding protein [Oscillospiraceae bacterium]|nr:extracellular solute-binding protein [Oscillospiraceae bacterium]